MIVSEWFSSNSTFFKNSLFRLVSQEMWKYLEMQVSVEDNPHSLTKPKQQCHFSVKVWINIINDNLTGLPLRLNSESYFDFLQEQFFHLVEYLPLRTKMNMYDSDPENFRVNVCNNLTLICENCWIRKCRSHLWPPDLNPLNFCICGFLKELVNTTV